MLRHPYYLTLYSSSQYDLAYNHPHFLRIRISIKNAIFWDVTPCRSCVNRRVGGTYRLHLQGRKIRERRTSSLADFFTLKMEAIRSSETSVHTRSTRRHIPEDGILHSHRRENLKSYNNRYNSNKVHALFLKITLGSYNCNRSTLSKLT
jgi:hypothetical protein